MNLIASRVTESADEALERAYSLLIDDARRGLEDVSAGHTVDADSAIEQLQKRLASVLIEGSSPGTRG